MFEDLKPVELMDPEDPYECSICLESFFLFIDACHHVYYNHHTPGIPPSQNIHQRSDRDETVERYRWEDEYGGYPDDWDEIREEVLERDDYICQECGRDGSHVDHIVPMSKGGSHKLRNLQVLCWGCHLKKHPHMRNRYRTK